jgi:hypothetical protein
LFADAAQFKIAVMPMLFRMENAMYRCISAGVFFLMLSAGARAENCDIHANFLFNQVNSGTMAAKSGTPCLHAIEATAGTTVIKSVRIVSPPKNGSASALSNGFTYQSKPGFKGIDTFTYEVFGDGKVGRNVTASVQLSVYVE